MSLCCHVSSCGQIVVVLWWIVTLSRHGANITLSAIQTKRPTGSKADINPLATGVHGTPQGRLSAMPSQFRQTALGAQQRTAAIGTRIDCLTAAQTKILITCTEQGSASTAPPAKGKTQNAAHGGPDAEMSQEGKKNVICISSHLSTGTQIK
jgi:hypothetical protein